ncbi:hypothetical protein SLS62_006002 [Diatrype stigma]|uniref:Uncharacterized protein n=1 Tax=Diatrype stigma TaxID=117547 RepID=A0AAN9UQI7_9PEZI
MSTKNKNLTRAREANMRLEGELLMKLAEIIECQQASGKEKDFTIANQLDVIAKEKCINSHQEFKIGYLEEALRDVGIIRDHQEDKLDQVTEELDKVTGELEEADSLIEDLARELVAFRQDNKEYNMFIKTLQRKSDRQSRELALSKQEIKDSKILIKTLQRNSDRHSQNECKHKTLIRHLRADVAHLSRELSKAKNAESAVDRARRDVAYTLSDKELYTRLMRYGDKEQALKVLESARRLDQLQAVDRAWMYQDQEEDTTITKKSDNGDYDHIREFISRAAVYGIRISKPDDHTVAK